MNNKKEMRSKETSMSILCRLFIICAVVFSGKLSAQTQSELYELMHGRGEYYFTVDVENPAEIRTINRICSVDATDGATVVCYANQMEYDEMLRAGYKPVLMLPPSKKSTYTMWDGTGKYAWNAYLTYPQYVSMMEGFPAKAQSAGRHCTVLTLGTLSTANHRKLLGVRINNGSPEGKPRFLYTSTIHGDEITGMILMLRLINELCTSKNERIAHLVNSLDIFIVPNANPDGTYYIDNNTVDGARRYNGNDTDLNRHFPDFDKGEHPDGATAYQDEAQWMMDLAQQYLFTMSANYHGGAEVVNYPWDTYQPLHPDDAWWQLVCSEYVSNAREADEDYMTDTDDSGITNGYAWYTISGSRQDYMNYYAQCREVTIECSTQKTPVASELPTFWNNNHNAMLAYMEQCLNGIHGFVYDAVTGNPVEGVTVTIQNHDSHGSAVTTHEAGDFHRPVKGGTYTLLFTKDGYCLQTVDVTVTDGERVELNNIQLEPGNCLLPLFSATSTAVSLGQTVSFTDTSYGNAVSWQWTFEGATPSTSTARNPKNITYNTAGTFDVTLTVTDADGNSATLTKNDFIHVTEAVTMHQGSVTTCDAMFYDSGNAGSNYGNNESTTLTFYPGSEGAKVCVDFQEFSVESGYDYLYIYDGTSTSATLIGSYSGSTSPGTVTATNAAGALTFRFTSDSSVNKPGWVATVTCVYPTVVLADGGANSSVITEADDGNPRNVKLGGRTLYKDGTWNTICLPFDVDIDGSPLKGATARTLTGYRFTDSTKLQLTFGKAVSTLLAGVPYIIKWDDDPSSPTIFEPTFQHVIVSDDENFFDQGYGEQRVRFMGTKDLVTFETEDRSTYFLGPDNKLYYPLSNATVGACHAYFKIGDGNDSNARQWDICIDNGDPTSTTAIDNTTSHINDRNRDWYTLDGRKLNGTPKRKGLYIYRSESRNGYYLKGGTVR